MRMTGSEDFDDAWPVLERALNVYPFQTCGRQQLLAQIESGGLRLWRSGNSFMVTSETMNPAGLRVLNIHLAGGLLSEVVAMERQLATLAKNDGIAAIQINGRRGWLKAFDGYHDAGTLMGKAL